MVLVGVQPSLIQVPPTCRLSTRTVLRPAWARAMDSGVPPCPEPITMASTVSIPFPSPENSEIPGRFLPRTYVHYLETGATQTSSRPLACDLAVEQNGPAVDEDMLHPHGVVQRIVVSGDVPDRSGIEHRDVGRHSGAQNAAVSDSDTAGGLRGHFLNRFLQVHRMLPADILGENARECPKRPGMGLSGAERPVFRLCRRI